MIVDAIWGWVLALLTWVLGLLPTLELGLGGLHELDAYAGWIGAVVDIPALITMATWIATCETALWAYRILMSTRQLKLF